MKKLVVIAFLVSLAGLLNRCDSPGVSDNMKDLDQNMLDLGMYHDNLGIHLRAEDPDYASWLLEGMDSTLQVIAGQFEEHRKLTLPFKKAYKKQLVPSIEEMRQALLDKNFAGAIKSYRLLTKKCNDCHIDNDVNKEVLDLSDPSYNE